MAIDTKPAAFYADFKGLASLKNDATAQDPKALRETARQFESLFTQMMLKSMRQASLGKGLMESDQSDFYREMFDNQMASQMSKGKGLGLADMLVNQLRAPEKREAGREGGFSLETRDAGRGTSIKASTQPLALPKTDSPTLKFTPPSNAPLASKPSKEAKVTLGTPDLTLKHAPPTNAPIALNAALELAIAQANATIAEDGEVRVWCGNGDDVVEPIATDASATSALTNHESRVTNHESPVSIETTRDGFVRQLWPHAKAAADELGVDAHMLIAQAALETGWGKSIPCNPDGTCSFNLFGIKAGSRWQGPAVGVNTLEFEGGVAVQRRASFRAYESPADSFRDYATLIKTSPRYAAAVGVGDNVAAFANALQQGGYATDPNYANKLTAVAERLRATLKTASQPPLALGRSVSGGSGGET